MADALEVIRERIAGARRIVPPTVALELAYLSEFADEEEVRTAAQTALRSFASKWKIQPVNLVPVGHGMVDAIAAKIRAQGCCRMRRRTTRSFLRKAPCLNVRCCSRATRLCGRSITNASRCCSMRRTSRRRSSPRLARLCGSFSAESFAAPAGKRSAQHVPSRGWGVRGRAGERPCSYAPRATRAISRRRRAAGYVGGARRREWHDGGRLAMPPRAGRKNGAGGLARRRE